MKRAIFLAALLCAAGNLHAASQAADPNAPAGMTTDANAMSNQTIQLQAHQDAVETFLNVSLQYLDGLDRQLKTNVPLSNGAVQEHVNIYTQKSMDALKNARVHLTEFQGVLTRAPAAEKDAQDSVGKTRTDLDKALAMNDALGNRIQTQHSDMSIDMIRKQVSDLQSQVKSTLSDAKSLKTGS